MAQPPHVPGHRAAPAPAARSPLTPLAFQAWDAVGWAGQAVFTMRVLHQWIASERAKDVVLPRSYWTWSLIGTAALVVYCFHRGDPVFLAGALVNGSLYARNAWMMRRAADAAPTRSVLWPVALGLVAFGAVAVWAGVRSDESLWADVPLAWLAVGSVGQALWSSRFIVQWFVSERLGRSVLPPSFFVISLAGSAVLLVYAIHRVDWVQMFAFGLNPIPYGRNLVLLARRRRAQG